MIEGLEQIIDDVASRNSKLVLIVGASETAKSLALANIASRRTVPVRNVGRELGKQLLSLSAKQRALDAPVLLRQVVALPSADALALLDKIEILFDESLKLDPIELLKQMARARPVVAVWPGHVRNGRLTYSELGHPEHRDYAADGIVLHEIQ